MKRIAVFLIICLAGLLPGCVGYTLPAEDAFQTVSPNLTDSATQNSTPTQTQQGKPTRRATVTSVYWQEEKLEEEKHDRQSNKPATPTLTYTPTRTATATPKPSFPPLPTISLVDAVSSYNLMPPAPEDLLALINAVNEQERYIRDHVGYKDQAYKFMREENLAVKEGIGFELSYHYPEGLPDPQLVFKSPLWGALFPDIYFDFLEDALLNDILTQRIHLEEQAGKLKTTNYEVDIFQVEIDHDPQPEWLLKISWEHPRTLTWLALDENTDLAYTKLESELTEEQYFVYSSNIEALQDFTGDGLTDIVILDSGYMMGTNFGTFTIVQGTSQGFRVLERIDHAVSVTLELDLPYHVDILKDSPWVTLTITNPNYVSWGCLWDTVTNYRWPNGQRQVTVTGKEPPDTPECNLARAVSLFDPPPNATAIRLLENSLRRFDAEDPEQAAKALFARYRLAVLYTLEGAEAKALQSLQVFREEWAKMDTPEAGVWLEDNFLPVLAEKPLKPILLCDAIASLDYNEIPEEWRNYVNASAAIFAYPWSGEIYPPALCPLRDLLAERLERVRFDPAVSPESALIDAGIPVAAVHEYPIPNEKNPAWFALIGGETLYAIGFVPMPEGWSWQMMHRFEPADFNPEIFFEDVTGDGYIEFAFIVPTRFSWGCPNTHQRHEVLLTTASSFGYVSMAKNICTAKGELLDIRTSLADEDGDGLVDWVVKRVQQDIGDAGLSAERTGPLSWFTPEEVRGWIEPEEMEEPDLAKKLFEGGNPAQVRQALQIERANLDYADPLLSRKWQRLTYLIAVSYELEGQAVKAVETFIEIIQAEPHTLWGNLAAIHLKN